MLSMIEKLLKKIFASLGVNVRRISRKSSDQIIKTRVGKFDLWINETHPLPQYLKSFPSYSSNLPRLVALVKEKYPNLILIDVGANIGDTVALVRSSVDCPIICIEGDTKYYSLLEKNMVEFEDIRLYQTFLGEMNSEVRAHGKNQDGTTRIVPSDNRVLRIASLDTLYHDQKFTSAKVIKIDTDGYDLKIIKGAKNYINEVKPIIFFEYDRLLFEEVGDDGISTLNMLEEFGYVLIFFYDNFGRYILSTKLSDHDLVLELHDYIKEHKGAFPYYDVCLFPSSDQDIAEKFKKNEMIFRVDIHTDLTKR